MTAAEWRCVSRLALLLALVAGICTFIRKLYADTEVRLCYRETVGFLEKRTAGLMADWKLVQKAVAEDQDFDDAAKSMLAHARYRGSPGQEESLRAKSWSTTTGGRTSSMRRRTRRSRHGSRLATISTSTSWNTSWSSTPSSRNAARRNRLRRRLPPRPRLLPHRPDEDLSQPAWRFGATCAPLASHRLCSPLGSCPRGTNSMDQKTWKPLIS